MTPDELRADLLKVGRLSVESGGMSATRRVSLDPVYVQALVDMSDAAAARFKSQGRRVRIRPNHMADWLLADALGTTADGQAWLNRLHAELAKPASRRK